ncbi:unnamed protein product [Oppiella nova]|uniref:UDP-xylose and UDP-N-acetylglucosamine transporter n=1 Tax=Oppiella nova TaxID=334625 RepID=A0A7R9M3E7_9ACAR|nr:unnamed protein product [Oppiella nova]CAG2170018.1 unnamed protein product [Oppiella nova]
MKYSHGLKIAEVIAVVMMGCGANLVCLEAIIRQAPGAGNAINLAQNALISVDGFLFTTRCGTKSSAIPLNNGLNYLIQRHRNYILLVIQFFVVSLSSSYANVYRMPMPLIMIFRSVSDLSVNRCISDKTDSNDTISPYDWTVGIGLTLVSLFVSANVGVTQEKLHLKFGKHPREALFYTHFLQLPVFLLLTSDIANHFVIFNNSDPFVIDLLVLSLSLPKLWLLLLLNCLAQYVCIRSVFVLTTECTSLTVTLVLTIRKFLSIIVSIFYFNNPFTTSHWLGTVLVFIGTLLFVNIPLRFYKHKVK